MATGIDVFLERWRIAVRTATKGLEEMPGVTDIEIMAKLFDYGNMIGTALSASVLTSNIDTVKFPANWVEAVKERWFPCWIKKHFPVKYQAVDIKALYPKAKLPDPVFKAVPRKCVVK